MALSREKDAIFIAMPYWRTPETIRRAVESILAQTHRRFILVVMNDGDRPELAWAPLAGIDDPRLIRFDLRENRGWPFADAVALGACDFKWFSSHDSDDHSRPERFERLLGHATNADVVLQHEVVVSLDGKETVVPVRDFKRGDRTFRHHAVRAGLYRASWLRRVGGTHPGFRVGYDSLLTSLAFLTGRVQVVRTPLYCRVKREGSLTQSPDTGMRSAMRQTTRAELERLWLDSYLISRRLPDSTAAIGQMIRNTIAPEDADAVQREVTRLRTVLARWKAER